MLLCTLGSCTAPAPDGRGEAPVYHFTNGQWFDGDGFVPAEYYVEGEHLTAVRPARVDSVIDLQGRFVVPPFGEAHSHLLGDPALLEEQAEMYLRDGVFYVMNQDPIGEVGPGVLARVNLPATVDVVYTRGVVAPSWSIVARLYEYLSRQGAFAPDTTLEALDTRVIFLMDDARDLEEKWDRLAARNEHFIKIILAFSEEQERRKGNPAYGFELGSHSALPGIDPELLPALVERAHGAGLRTSVHIETAADFRRAVAAGTDLIAHLPASWQIGRVTGFTDDGLTHWRLTEEDALSAAARGVVVITTAFTPADHPEAERFAAVHRHNLALLYRHGVSLALGSDQFEATSRAEAGYISGLDVLDNRTILDLLSRGTPQAIFPGRRIGVLAEGYEASFLVLAADPLQDLEHIRAIELRMKQGRLLD